MKIIDEKEMQKKKKDWKELNNFALHLSYIFYN